MQSQQHARGPGPAAPPGHAPPISMTMSLNGPPGYQMHSAIPTGSFPASLPRQEAGGGSNVGMREVHGTAMDPARAQREAYIGLQQSGHSKAGAGGVVAGHGYPVRHDALHMSSQPAPQLHSQHQMAQHHQQQHQQPAQHQQHHGMAASHHRAVPVSMAHHMYPQQQAAQPSPHSAVQHPMQAGLTGKESRGSISTGVFKTPSSSGYPAPSGHQANGMPSHPQQYPGYPMMKDAARSDAAVLEQKQRSEAVGGMAVGAYRHGTTGASVESGMMEMARHQHSSQPHSHQTQHPQMMMPAQQQQQHTQKVQHAFPGSSSHYPSGQVAQKPMLPPTSTQLPQLPTQHPQHPHAIPPQSPTRTGMTRSPASASAYGPAPPSPQLHPSVHPALSPSVKEHHHPHRQQTQPLSHHRPPTPTLPTVDIHQRWASGSGGVMSHIASEVTKHMASDMAQQGSRQVMGMGQAPAGSIRTGEPRVQAVPGDVASAGTRAANPMMLSNGAPLPPAMAKGSIQLGTPAMKPVTVNADVKVQEGGCKTSPGNGSGVPLDLSKIRPETGRQGDAPLDLSVKARKRSVEDSNSVGHPLVKKPRQDEPAAKGGLQDAYYAYSRADRPGEEWPSPMPVPGKTGMSGTRSSAQNAGNVPALPSPTLHQGFKHHTPSPGAVPYSPSATAGQVSPMSTVPPKVPHAMTYPPADRPRGVSGSSQSQRQSIEMSFEGKVEDCTSLMPKLVQGISAPPTMTMSLQTQLERAQHMQVRADPVPGHGQMKPPARHPQQHPMLPQQHHQKPAPPKEAAPSAGYVSEKHRMEDMHKMYQHQQQQQLQRQQQAGYLHKTPPQNIPTSPRAYPQTSAASGHAALDHAAGEYVSSQHMMAPQSHQAYTQQQQQQSAKYHHQQLQQQQAQYHQRHMHMMQEHQKQQRQQQQLQQQRHTSYGPDGKPTERRLSAESRYSQYVMQQREEEVRRAKLPSPSRVPDGHSEDRMGWGPHLPSHPSQTRAAGQMTGDAYSSKSRERGHLSRSGSKTDMAATPSAGQEHRRTPQSDDKRKDDSYLARRASTDGFPPHDRHPAGASPGVYPPPNTTPSSLASMPSKSVEGSSLTGGESSGVHGHCKREVSPVPVEVRRRSDSAGRESQGSRPSSRPSSASRQSESRSATSTPSQSLVPAAEQQSESTDGFQRPQQLATAGSGGKEAAKAGETSETGTVEEASSSKVGTGRSEASPRDASPRPVPTKTPTSNEEFATPLSISIPSSPSVGPASSSSVTSNKPASPAPPPPPPSSGSKMWSRKRMILNAVSQDESLKKTLGVSSVVPPGAKPEHQRLRQFSSSPPPSSPKMPILSPQEKGGDADVTASQNEDPPDLVESPGKGWKQPRGPSSLTRTAGGAGSGATVTEGTATVPSGVPTPNEGTKPPGPERQAAPAGGSTAAPAAPGEGDSQQEKASPLVNRPSGPGADTDRAATEPSSQQTPPHGVGYSDMVSWTDAISRPEVIRRSSLDRPWGHQKNIPVANVAPFMHSKSGPDAPGREMSDSSQPPSEAPVNASQPKADDSKTEQGDETKPPSPDVPASKSPSHTTRHKDSSGSESRKSTHRSKAMKKSDNLLKRLARIGKSKRKSYELEDLGVHPVPLKYKVLKCSRMTVDQHLESLSADTESLERSLSGKASKQKRAKLKKKRDTSGGEKARSVKDSGTEELEGEEKGTAEPSDKAQEEKAKKELALSREERAKRRALLRGKEEEKERKANRRQKAAKSRTARRRLSSTNQKVANQKAQELKRTALGRRPRREAARRKSGRYNRNAAYEEEVRRDESRKAIRRARRRQASNIALVKLQQQQQQQGEGEGDEQFEDDDDDDDDASQDSQNLERWSSTSGGHAHSSRPSRKSKTSRGIMGSTVPEEGGEGATPGSSGSRREVMEGWDQEDEYCDDADDESKDVSEDDDGEDTEAADGNSSAGRSKSRSLVLRKKKRGKLRPVRRKLLDASFGEDTLEASCFEDVVLEGDESLDASSQSAIPVPPEVKRIAVNKNSGETLLHRAARLGNEEVTLYCLRSGEYTVNARDNAGYTALHESCVKGSVRVARHLILHGADVNCCSQDGIRPLHDAIENDHMEVARLLLSYGADPLIATYGGRTPLKIARSHVMYEVLKGYLGDLNGYDSEEEKPWSMPGSYGLHSATGNPDNGFDIFADVPSDDDDEDDKKLENMFDDGILATVPTYELPGEKPHNSPRIVVLQDELLRHLHISFKHFSSLTSCVRAQIHVSREQVARMLERSVFRRSTQHQEALLQADRVTAIPLAVLRKVEATLEQLARRSASKGTSSHSMELQPEREAALIERMKKLLLCDIKHDDEYDADTSSDTKDIKFKMASSGFLKQEEPSANREKIPPFAMDEKAQHPWLKDEKTGLPKGFEKNRESVAVGPSVPGKSPLSRSHSDRTGQSTSCLSQKTSVRRVLSEKTGLFTPVDAVTGEDKPTSYSHRLVESSNSHFASLPPSSSGARPGHFTLRAARFHPKTCKSESKEGEKAAGFTGTPFSGPPAAASTPRVFEFGAKPVFPASRLVFGSLSSLKEVHFARGSQASEREGSADLPRPHGGLGWSAASSRSEFSPRMAGPLKKEPGLSVSQGETAPENGGPSTSGVNSGVSTSGVSLGGMHSTGFQPTRHAGSSSISSAPGPAPSASTASGDSRSHNYPQGNSTVPMRPFSGQQQTSASTQCATAVPASSVPFSQSTATQATSTGHGFPQSFGRDVRRDVRQQWSSSFQHQQHHFNTASRSSTDSRDFRHSDWSNSMTSDASSNSSSASKMFPPRDNTRDSRGAPRWAGQGPGSQFSNSFSSQTAGGPAAHQDFRTGRWPPSQTGYAQTSHPQSGHPQPGQAHSSQTQHGHPQPGHQQTGHAHTGHPQTGHPQTGYLQPGRTQTGHQQTGHTPQGHPQSGHQQPGHVQTGYTQTGLMQTGQKQAAHQQPGHPQTGHPQMGQQQTGHPQTGRHSGAPLARGPPQPGWQSQSVGPSPYMRMSQHANMPPSGSGSLTHGRSVHKDPKTPQWLGQPCPSRSASGHSSSASYSRSHPQSAPMPGSHGRHDGREPHRSHWTGQQSGTGMVPGAAAMRGKPVPGHPYHPVSASATAGRHPSQPTPMQPAQHGHEHAYKDARNYHPSQARPEGYSSQQMSQASTKRSEEFRDSRAYHPSQMRAEPPSAQSMSQSAARRREEPRDSRGYYPSHTRPEASSSSPSQAAARRPEESRDMRGYHASQGRPDASTASMARSQPPARKSEEPKDSRNYHSSHYRPDNQGLAPGSQPSGRKAEESKDSRNYHTPPARTGTSSSQSVSQSSSKKSDEAKDGKAKASKPDFDQMFSDESSSSSFATVVDNLDYDSSRSPVSNTTTATSNTTTAAQATAGGGGSGKDATSSSSTSSSSGKGFGFGAFASAVTGKDRNDNDISIFPPKKTT